VGGLPEPIGSAPDYLTTDGRPRFARGRARQSLALRARGERQTGRPSLREKTPSINPPIGHAAALLRERQTLA
jgi:hypothetical protein